MYYVLYAYGRWDTFYVFSFIWEKEEKQRYASLLLHIQYEKNSYYIVHTTGEQNIFMIGKIKPWMLKEEVILCWKKTEG